MGQKPPRMFSGGATDRPFLALQFCDTFGFGDRSHRMLQNILYAVAAVATKWASSRVGMPSTTVLMKN